MSCFPQDWEISMNKQLMVGTRRLSGERAAEIDAPLLLQQIQVREISTGGLSPMAIQMFEPVLTSVGQCRPVAPHARRCGRRREDRP
jgi:hypothetical protein